VFVHYKYFKPRIILVKKARHLELLHPSKLWPNLKILHRLKRISSDKHPSLFVLSTNEREKSFMALTPGHFKPVGSG
jgi:hypothetical protein